MACNVAVAHEPPGKLKPAKDKSIDGIVALIMANRPRHGRQAGRQDQKKTPDHPQRLS
jgi:hypothetical protein